MANDKPDKLQRILVRLGENPKRSVRFFIAGLVMFFMGLTVIYFGAATYVWLQIPGLIVLVIGLLLSLKGYIGIFCNRLAFFRHQSKLNREKYKHIK